MKKIKFSRVKAWALANKYSLDRIRKWKNKKRNIPLAVQVKLAEKWATTPAAIAAAVNND